MNLPPNYAAFARPFRMGLCAAILINIVSVAAMEKMDGCHVAGKAAEVAETCQVAQTHSGPDGITTAAASSSIGFGLAFAGMLPGTRRRSSNRKQSK